MIFHIDLNIYAFVGLIMLIGIVEKNAIMQIDFALEAERQHGSRAARGDLRRLPDPLPPDHDDHDGGAAGRGADRARLRRRRRSAAAAGLVVVGGLMFSQLVTLYLTPVFYTYMAGDTGLDAVAEKRKRVEVEAVVGWARFGFCSGTASGEAEMRRGCEHVAVAGPNLGFTGFRRTHQMNRISRTQKSIGGRSAH